MEPTHDPLSKPQRKLVHHFRQHGGEKHYAVARRQQWPKLLPIIDDLVKKVLSFERDSVAYQYLCSGLFLAGTGHITEAQLNASPALTDSNRADCIQLARIYDRQRPRLMPDEPPAPGQRITAKFKPDSYLGRGGSWHTGTIQAGAGGGFSIPGTGGISLDDILQWVPVLDEEPHDVAKRQYWEAAAAAETPAP